MNFARRLLLAWLMTWMALNGAIAGIMGWPAPAVAQAEAIGTSPMPCHDMTEMASPHDGHALMPEQPPATPSQQDSNCKHCQLCQIATSMLPLVTPRPIELPMARDYTPLPASVPHSHIPEPPQHIPLVPAA